MLELRGANDNELAFYVDGFHDPIVHEIKDLVEQFFRSETIKRSLPLERSFIAFLQELEPNCSYDPITSEQWDCINKYLKDLDPYKSDH